MRETNWMIKERMGCDNEVDIEGIGWNTWTAFSWVILGTSSGPL